MRDDEVDLSRIERRIGAIRSVRQVVHAIWALARAQLPLVEAAAQDATIYLDWIDDIVQRLAGPPAAASGEQVLHVVLGPERAYCGGLPRQILSQVPKEGRLGLVGRRFVEVADRKPAVARRVVFRLSGAVSHDDHGEVARRIAEAVLEHAGGHQVDMLHPTRGEPHLHRAVVLGGRRELGHLPPATLSPPRLVLDAALGESVAGRLAVAAAEAMRSEIQARIVAADSARKACDHRLDELATRWRTARQEQITSELLEVVSGRLAALGTEGGLPP